MQTDSAEKSSSVELIEVQDANERDEPVKKFCYTKLLLKDTLQFMGCKIRVAHKASKPYKSHSQDLSHLFVLPHTGVCLIAHNYCFLISRSPREG